MEIQKCWNPLFKFSIQILLNKSTPGCSRLLCLLQVLWQPFRFTQIIQTQKYFFSSQHWTREVCSQLSLLDQGGESVHCQGEARHLPGEWEGGGHLQHQALHLPREGVWLWQLLLHLRHRQTCQCAACGEWGWDTDDDLMDTDCDMFQRCQATLSCSTITPDKSLSQLSASSLSQSWVSDNTSNNISLLHCFVTSVRLTPINKRFLQFSFEKSFLSTELNYFVTEAIIWVCTRLKEWDCWNWYFEKFIFSILSISIPIHPFSSNNNWLLVASCDGACAVLNEKYWPMRLKTNNVILVSCKKHICKLGKYNYINVIMYSNLTFLIQLICNNWFETLSKHNLMFRSF